MKLPRGEDAIIPDGKIEDYCLNPNHPVGGPKARVLSAALGIDVQDADRLRVALRLAARTDDAVFLFSDSFGARYRVDFRFRNGAMERTLRSGWTIREPDGPPYLTTTFVLPSSHG
ncbi:DUF6883 domain-containing protein [Brevundimonas staleyi]|uniref:DUF6883 domain-containing protein n=1 Tax=Brevundimonas staleyi TaxID=74326 RepID=A0ABW0FTX4_9CAUL